MRSASRQSRARLSRVQLYRFVLVACLVLFSDSALAQAPAALPSLDEVVSAGRDLWGEAAMAQLNGPSYEFFKDLLPPPRYVHADFRYYPLVLSAPRATVKARLISNGSGVNLHGGSRSWKDIGFPVTIRVGPDEFRFGELRDRVSIPTLEQGYLPIYTIEYRHPFPVQSEGAVPLKQVPSTRPDEVYRLEAFASTNPAHAESGVVWIRFSLSSGAKGIVSLDLDTKPLPTFSKGELRLADGSRVIHADSKWKWSRGLLSAELSGTQAAVVAIVTKPLLPEAALPVSEDVYRTERQNAIDTWNGVLKAGTQVEIPESIVQNAWRNLLIQNVSLINGDRIFYSASNQYEQLYEAEGSDAALAMLMWGHSRVAKEVFPPLLDFKRPGLQSHINSLKVLNMAHYYWLTRDTQSLQLWRTRWEGSLEDLIGKREASSGLLPKERYCGDISTPVYSLSVDAKAWRAIHDIVPIYEALGDPMAAVRCKQEAEAFGKQLREAILKSVSYDTTPPFVPIALLDEEPVHSPITEVRIGSYWNIIMPYVIGSRVFPSGSAEESWIPHFVEQHGGLCMGMTRSGGTAHGFWTGRHRVNPLYGNRYVTDLFRRDDVDRALTSLYGMLAQGFTRNTFIVGEGCTLAPVDDGGRFFYCPPNTAGNGHFLTMLRNTLVQDWDTDEDGRPDTLRLMYGTSRRWLQDGQRIRVEEAPTAFGPVTCQVQSLLNQGTIEAEIKLSSDANFEPPRTIFLRARVPDGYRVVSSQVDQQEVEVDEQGSIRLNYRKQPIHVVFRVERRLP